MIALLLFFLFKSVRTFVYMHSMSIFVSAIRNSSTNLDSTNQRRVFRGFTLRVSLSSLLLPNSASVPATLIPAEPLFIYLQGPLS